MIASSRLASLASTIAMGGGPKPEHLLVILPFREPVENLERIKRKHPNIEITFRSLRFTDTPWKGVEDIPKGKLTSCRTIRRWENGSNAYSFRLLDIYKDATILVTLSAIPPSGEDCPKLGTCSPT